ncbi:MAG: chorismate synthase [Oscillospiraceae bacterium]|jgi:chorismate synthase|nr:chorismate synthase [Oscillospiraceae bacterium]
MSNQIGNRFRVLIYGQSHAPSIGCVIDGLPAGFRPDWDAVQAFMRRRAPGNSPLATARREADLPEILSGFNERGETCGAPLAMRIVNADPRSADYEQLRDVPRPGHADYPAHVKFDGHGDIRGGGQFSGRLTAPLCFAGALAMQLLEREGVRVCAHIARLAGIDDAQANAVSPNLDAMLDGELRVFSAEAGERMRAAILRAKADGDSVGGVIACFATGMPAGLGDPMFDGVENRLARALFGVPAVRGVEFGAGFAAAEMRGSAHNDAYLPSGDGIRTATNRHGGILGGITTGMPIIVRAAIKPTPSIALPQMSISLSRGESEALAMQGRHDPCIVPRAVPCIESAVAVTLYDLLCQK